MDKNTTRIVVIVTVIIIVAVILLMINNAKSKKMEALIREAELRSIEREAEYNARKKDEPVTEIVSTAVNPPAEDAEDAEDVEIVGDQSLVLDEDPVSEYNEMADDSGISKIVPPQVDKNWVESRQVEPVKDLSVGIAIVNDVSKTENLQTGKTSYKYPFKHGTGIRAECADGKCGDPSKYPQPKPLGSVRRMDGTYSNMDAVRIAAKNAAQKRDTEIKRVLDEKVRSQAKSAAMKQRMYADTSKIKQYDVKPSKAPPASLMRPTGPSFGSMRPTGPSFGSMRPSFGLRPAVMSPDHAMKIRQAAMKAAEQAEKEKIQAAMEAQRAAMEAAEQDAMKAAEQVEKEKIQAAMEAQQAAMEAAEQDAMKAAADAENEEKMKAVQAAIAGIEGYEIMKPLGSMVY